MKILEANDGERETFYVVNINGTDAVLSALNRGYRCA